MSERPESDAQKADEATGEAASDDAKSAKSEDGSVKTTSTTESKSSSESSPSESEDEPSQAASKSEGEGEGEAAAKASVKPSPAKGRGIPVRWLAVAGAVAVAVIAALLLSSGKSKPRVVLPDLALSPADQSAMLGYARAALEEQTLTPLPPHVAKICGRHVFIELFRNAPENFIYAVSDPVLETKLCMPQALENAVRRLKGMKAFKEAWTGKTKEARLALSVNTTAIEPARIVYAEKTEKMKGLELKRVGWRLHSEDVEIGKTGLYLRTLGDKDVKRLWAPPMQGVVNAHGREDNYIHLREYSKRHFARIGFKATKEKADKPKVKAYSYQAMMMLEREPGESSEPLNPTRGNILYGRVDADDIYDTAVHMTDYLVSTLDANGRFDYEYYADSDTSSKSYNIVRHAGTTYSVLLTHRYTGDKKYLDAGLRAKDYIVQNLKYQEYKPMPYHGKPGSVPAPFPEPDGSVKLLALVEGERVALGATALSLLAFTQIPREAIDPADAERIRHMVNFTWYLQCESGGFYTDYKEALTTKCPDPQPLYFPGETLLALNSLHKTQPDPAYFRLSEKSVGFELQRFRDGTWPDHWVMQALDLLVQSYPDPAREGKWADAAHDMAKKYIASQYLYDRDYAPKPPDKALEGGYRVKGGPPRNTPTGSRSEAVAGVYRLLMREKRTEEAKVLGDHLLAAAYFLTQEMYRPENVYYLKDPKQSMWGLRGSMIDPTVRIDFNQHALVGIWGAWEVALDRGGIGWPLPEGELKAELEAKAKAGKLVTKWGTRKPID